MVRPPCNDKTNYKKRGWREEDDAKILHYVSSTHGKQESSSGLKRCGKSCKGKWSNEGFSQHEEELIIKLHAAVGSRWAIIAHQLPGRSDNDIKIHWNTKLKKKLTERGIDPVTHKPFSQILADYGKIGGLSRATTGSSSRYIGTMKGDFKKVASFTLPKPEPYNNFISNPQQIPNFSHDTSHSLDLLSQLQAISLVTEGTSYDNNKYYPHLKSVQLPFNNNSSSNSGYNNNNAGQVVKSPPESFSWHEFLLDEAINKPVQDQEQEQEQEFDDIRFFNSLQSCRMPEIGNVEFNGDQFQGVPSTSMSSQGSTFLEAMLDQETDMFLNFPGLMEEPLY
ncbi:transcription factor MYB35-like isoform X2 [Silene latifolia]|uniref:transcription factor MYB35-like isoform X2 n=1 Tax=Silene latifolia TaxID=37657 RepID=UPI003D76E1EA